MRRLAAATVMLTAMAVGAQAGGLPKAVRLVNRMKVYSPTHYIRGQQGGSGSDSGYSDEMARQDKQDKNAPRAATNQKQPKPAEPGQKPEKPQRADD